MTYDRFGGFDDFGDFDNSGIDASDSDQELHAIELQAELRKITSMADGTYNIIINVGEDGVPGVKQMLSWVRDEITLAVIHE